MTDTNLMIHLHCRKCKRGMGFRRTDFADVPSWVARIEHDKCNICDDGDFSAEHWLTEDGSEPDPDTMPTIDDEAECTDCRGTGVTIQTERRCACQPPIAKAIDANLMELAEAQPNLSSPVTAGMSFVQHGVGMYSWYAPDERGDPTIERWGLSTTDPDSEWAGNGHLEISVKEVVPTQSCGVLAVYYRQWFTPEGEPMTAKTRKVASLASLKALIRRRKMVHSEVSPA